MSVLRGAADNGFSSFVTDCPSSSAFSRSFTVLAMRGGWRMVRRRRTPDIALGSEAYWKTPQTTGHSSVGLSSSEAPGKRLASLSPVTGGDSYTRPASSAARIPGSGAACCCSHGRKPALTHTSRRSVTVFLQQNRAVAIASPFGLAARSQSEAAFYIMLPIRCRASCETYVAAAGWGLLLMLTEESVPFGDIQLVLPVPPCLSSLSSLITSR